MWWKDAGFVLLVLALLLVAYGLGVAQGTTLNPVDAYCHGAAEGTAAYYFESFGQMPVLALRQEYVVMCKEAIRNKTWLVMDLEGPILPK